MFTNPPIELDADKRFKFVATKGTEIHNVYAETHPTILMLRREFLLLGFSVSETVDYTTGRVIIEAQP